MSRKRKQIVSQVSTRLRKIEALKAEIRDLMIEYVTLSDHKLWYKNEFEKRRSGRKFVNIPVGKVYWNEYFKDEDTGKYFPVERSDIVKYNGEWLEEKLDPSGMEL